MGDELLEYPNVPRVIGALVSTKYATLHELSTVLGAEDAQDLLEVMMIDHLNKKMIDKRERS